jgi:cell division septum initiation protein DivIVA
MTKKAEIAILTKAAADLGTASYLGPWLSIIIDELERDLYSDFLPLVTLGEARYRAQRVAIEANDKAEAIVAKAKADADKIVAEANDRRNRIVASLKQVLKSAADTL